jgi:hypothetical protein
MMLCRGISESRGASSSETGSVGALGSGRASGEVVRFIVRGEYEVSAVLLWLTVWCSCGCPSWSGWWLLWGPIVVRVFSSGHSEGGLVQPVHEPRDVAMFAPPLLPVSTVPCAPAHGLARGLVALPLEVLAVGSTPDTKAPRQKPLPCARPESFVNNAMAVDLSVSPSVSRLAANRCGCGRVRCRIRG